MKKYGLPANSGAVHGARYNARTMVYHVAAEALRGRAAATRGRSRTRSSTCC